MPMPEENIETFYVKCNELFFPAVYLGFGRNLQKTSRFWELPIQKTVVRPIVNMVPVPELYAWILKRLFPISGFPTDLPVFKFWMPPYLIPA